MDIDWGLKYSYKLSLSYNKVTEIAKVMHV